jgi:hypothetical protein
MMRWIRRRPVPRVVPEDMFSREFMLSCMRRYSADVLAEERHETAATLMLVMGMLHETVNVPSPHQEVFATLSEAVDRWLAGGRDDDLRDLFLQVHVNRFEEAASGRATAFDTLLFQMDELLAAPKDI